MDKLPIYTINTESTKQFISEGLKDLLVNCLGISEFTPSRSSDRIYFKSNDFLADADLLDRSIYIVNNSKLWRPSENTKSMDKHRATKIVANTFEHNGLLSIDDNNNLNQIIKTEMLDPLPSYLSVLNTETNKRDNTILDYRLRFKKSIKLEDFSYEQLHEIPIVGPSNKLGLTVNYNEDIVAINANVIVIDPIHFESRVIAREEADRLFKKITEKLRVQSYSANLIYYEQSSRENPEKKYLSPHWAFKSTINLDGRLVSNKIIMIPATEHEPIRTTPTILSKRLNVSEQPRYEIRDLTHSFDYKIGTSWIGPAGGLLLSEDNASGFINGLEDIGWRTVFNHGDCQAWLSDWISNNDTFVDKVHLVFYAGHCGPEGWYLVNPSDCTEQTLLNSYVGSIPEHPGDKWGNGDLNWIIISACGPFEDDLISPGGGNALDRWKGMFDGLHMVLGYGSTTIENDAEGKRFVRYCLEGQSILSSWFRSAIEIQETYNDDVPPWGPITYVSAMWASNDTSNPFNDHLFGYGPVSSDPTDPKKIHCLWVPC
jgi:hypothetical protein